MRSFNVLFVVMTGDKEEKIDGKKQKYTVEVSAYSGNGSTYANQRFSN
jgi:hypothetical protein